MDLKLIRNLVRLMERGEVSELEISDEKAGLSVRLKRGSVVDSGGGAPVVNLMGATGAQLGHTGLAPVMPVPGGEEEELERRDLAGVEEFPSPMVGSFYRAPSPDTDPFVRAGDEVDEESVLCIIEAMKVMNEIKAECRGTIVEVLADNGDPVEFGQPLFLIKTT